MKIVILAVVWLSLFTPVLAQQTSEKRDVTALITWLYQHPFGSQVEIKVDQSGQSVLAVESLSYGFGGLVDDAPRAPPPGGSPLASQNSVADFEQFSHPTDANATDTPAGTMLLSLRNASQQAKDLRLCTWSTAIDPGDIYDYTIGLYPTKCWFTVEVKIPTYIDGPGTGSQWLNLFQLKSPDPSFGGGQGRFGSHEPIIQLNLYGDTGEQGFYGSNYITSQSGQDIPIANNQWYELELYVEMHPTAGVAEIYVDGQLAISHIGDVGFIQNPFPIFCIGHYGRYGDNSWQEIEFRNATITLDRLP